MHPTQRRINPLWLLPLAAIYLFGLHSMGLVTPDEPRYADIGRAMAHSGDWITPRLFGAPWFEKPALLYWMTALGNLVGLGLELAPRLPVALLSLGFLTFFYHRVRSIWNPETALYSTAILATSAGWLAYSRTGVTDIPVSVFFNAAVLFALPWALEGKREGITASAICLAFGFLAKGIVPLVLFLPVVAFGWRRLGNWFVCWAIPAFFLIAAPWYVAVSLRSNGEFLRVFFLEHTFGRVVSTALQHVQPWWFYLPVLLLLLFPWFPLLVGAPLRAERNRLLLLTVLFGLFTFSVSINKLPGYVLPLTPLLAILAGDALAADAPRRKLIAAVAGFTGLLPIAAAVLPGALAQGLRHTQFPWLWLASVPVCGLAGWWVGGFRREFAFGVLTAVLWVSFLATEALVLPAVDRAASARPVWIKTQPNCLKNMSRSMVYGLQYYAGHTLPECPLLDPDNPRVVR